MANRRKFAGPFSDSVTLIRANIASLQSSADSDVLDVAGSRPGLAEAANASLFTVAVNEIGAFVPVGTFPRRTGSESVVARTRTDPSNTRGDVFGKRSSVSADFVVANTYTTGRTLGPAASSTSRATLGHCVELAFSVRAIDSGKSGSTRRNVVLAITLRKRSGTVIVADSSVTAVANWCQASTNTSRVDNTVGVRSTFEILLSRATSFTVAKDYQCGCQ